MHTNIYAYADMYTHIYMCTEQFLNYWTNNLISLVEILKNTLLGEFLGQNTPENTSCTMFILVELLTTQQVKSFHYCNSIN